MDTFGEASNPALLLLPGAGNSRFAWRDAFCARLADGGRFVLRCDLAGASLEALVAHTLDVLDDAGVARAHVAGLSLGGMVALQLALDQRARVLSLTLFSTSPGGDDLPGPDDGLFDDLPAPPDWTDREAVIAFLVESEHPFSPYFDEPAARAYAERVAAHGLEPVRRFIEASFEFGAPARPRLGELDLPTLVVHGADDPMFGLEHGETLAREISGARLLVLPETGHEYPPPRHWDAVIEAMTALPEPGPGRASSSR